MKYKLLYIINKFGINNQLKKLNEECYELIESIRDYEDSDELSMEDCKRLKEHIKEEFADVMVLLNEISSYYEIDYNEIEKLELQKVDRTLKRIEENYYK